MMTATMPPPETPATSDGDEATRQTRKPTLAAYDRVLLPVIKLRASSHSKQLEQRVNYLWSAAHAVVATSPSLAHTMMSSVMQLAREHHADLPRSVLDYVCERCAALLVPSVTAVVRVVPQTHQSALNRKLLRRQRQQQPASELAMRKHHAHRSGHHALPWAPPPAAPGPRREILVNAVRLRCQRCNHDNMRPGASVVIKPTPPRATTVTKRQRIEIEAGSSTGLTATVEEEDSVEADTRDAKRARTKTATVTVMATATAEVSVSLPALSPVTDVSVPLAGSSGAGTATQHHHQQPAPAFQGRSMFAAPPSPPRKLLDGPKRKKKKKTKPADPAATAVQTGLNALLQSLRPSVAP